METRPTRRREDSVQSGARLARMLGLIPQVRVDLERDIGRRVAHLPRDEDDVQPLGDEQRAERVAKIVEPKLPEARPLERLVEPAACEVPRAEYATRR